MIMLTKQEQEILDNAPDWATHFMKHADLGFAYAEKRGETYHNPDNCCEYFVGALLWENRHNLSDLRNKRGKTVVDAIAEFGVEFPTSDGYDDNLTQIIQAKKEFNGYKKGELANGSSVRDNGYWRVICTTEEFNQCVNDMAEARWMNKAGDFFCYESYKEDYQEPTKPRVKVEYVRARFSKLSDAFAEHEKTPLYICDRGEYHKANGLWIYNIVEAGEWFSLYRKVEAEIKTEKRWVIVTDIAYKELYTSIEDAEAYAFHMGLKPQYIEITVEV